MPVPDADRVLYEKNPLHEVICQVRFPSVLRIDSEPPAGFQESIRDDYPNYEVKASTGLPAGLPPRLAKLVAGEGNAEKTHEFVSRNEVWKLTLHRDFLALTCKHYERWEGFLDRFHAGLNALIDAYRPAFFSRVGLRYQNLIARGPLGLAETPWSELLNPAVGGIFADTQVSGDIEAAVTVVVLNLPGGIGKAQCKFTMGEEQTTKESVILVDNDFFTDQQTELGDVLNRLGAFNRQARLFFRWCITERLHQSMRPQPVPAD